MPRKKDTKPYDVVEHFRKGTFEEQYWIPAHNKRRASALFRKNKKLIRDECGAPCWVCGSRREREVHHVFEWSFWNAMDPRKVTNTLRAIEFYECFLILQLNRSLSFCEMNRFNLSFCYIPRIQEREQGVGCLTAAPLLWPSQQSPI